MIRHFRDVHDILRLNGAGSLRVRVDLLDAPFSNSKRAEYLKAICDAIGNSEGPPCIVFLDPDNGLGSKVIHVRPDELPEIWNRMRPDDVLVFYQHSHRKKQWLEIRRREFQQALQLPAGTALIARGGIIPTGKRKRFCPDVAFFFVQKPHASTSPAE